MSVKAIHNFEHAVHVANEWVKALAQAPEIGCESQAYSILRVVLHCVRDRLTVTEVAHLSAQLPMLIRGFFYEGWEPNLEPETNETFLADVSLDLLRVSEIEAEDAIYLVYDLLKKRVSPGEMQYIERALPYNLISKWR